ncbi:uncharacterized protein LOC126885927 isoform X1 [Diabrotica virgifera virgifera]|uniref:Uncharacterized protein n=1 Tax=Diabrotica virgifera virgifera TaxID=50390 RepID=A0ABM5KES7_DIAVI|nr:uncharacterized protein LOC126885927 isoform X1 [Diabrotica virgifera virgifera]
MKTIDNKTFRSPAEFKGYPKAGPRKAIGRKRKSGRSMIATDTPEKNLIENAASEAAAKNSKISIPKRKEATKKIFIQESSDEDDPLDDWSATSSSGGSFDPDDIEQENAVELSFTPVEFLRVNEFVLVEFTDNKKFYYVGRVTKEKNDEDEVEISFLRKSAKVARAFSYPLVEDIAFVNIKDVKLILPNPEKKQGTKRTQSYLIFEMSFSNLDVR